MKRACLCYTLDTPVIYNKGTRFEKREDTFLEKICADIETAEKEAWKRNATSFDRIWFAREENIKFI